MTFCEATPDHLYQLCCLLLCFEVVLRLKIKTAKFELVNVGFMEDEGSLASILGCKLFSLPMKYICLSLGAQFKGKSIWNGIIKKKWNVIWQVGSGFICPRIVVGSS